MPTRTLVLLLAALLFWPGPARAAPSPAPYRVYVPLDGVRQADTLCPADPYPQFGGGWITQYVPAGATATYVFGLTAGAGYTLSVNADICHDTGPLPVVSFVLIAPDGATVLTSPPFPGPAHFYALWQSNLVPTETGMYTVRVTNVGSVGSDVSASIVSPPT